MAMANGDKGDKGPIRVLLADDHSVVRAGIRKFLETASDIEVVAEAEDGAEAQVLLARHQPDVAVLDIHMPRASGIEVTRWVREHLPAVGVLILTAYDDEPYVVAVLQAGANGYVLKTAQPADMIRAVRDVYEGRSALDSMLAQRLITHLVSPAEAKPEEPLSEREHAVLALVGKGYTNKAIAAHLGISDGTVQSHLARIFDKMGVTSRTGAVMRAVALGWLPPGTAETQDPLAA